MAEAVARAIKEQRHLVVQAGTGTGKSLAYLVPALVLGTRVVVSTATKALQDQLASRDLPQLAGQLGVPFEFALLKGRSNYICRQRVAEVAGGDQQLVLDPETGHPVPAQPGGSGTGSPSTAASDEGSPARDLFGEEEPELADLFGTARSGAASVAGTGRRRSSERQSSERRSGAAGLRRADAPLSPSGPAAGGQAESLGPLGREVWRLVEWAATAETGDRADLAWEPSPTAWAQVSVGARDCPGAGRCPSGSVCFAEAARQRAAQADVVVVNTHLYTAALAIGGELLPPHDLVVFDEAHELEDIASGAFGFEIGAGRFQALARASRPLLDDQAPALEVEDAALLLSEALRPHRGAALQRPLDEATQDRLTVARARVQRLQAHVRQASRAGGQSSFDAADGGAEPAGGDLGLRARHLRSMQAATHLLRDLDQVLELSANEVAWVEGPEHAPLLRVAPLDVGASFRERLWDREDAPTAILTSATIPPRLGERLGLPGGSFEVLDVGSPFAYDEQALLYCPLHLPDPRDPSYAAAMLEELVALIHAAEGRTLALFTSWRAMTAGAEAVRGRVPWTVLTQSDLPKPALVARFSADEHSCLFATMGFWQGVDVPGAALSVVAIDRLPFPRPDDPLLQARRANLGRDAFSLIDIPRAATLLAQGTGRLIRSRSDRGVVAVLDPRLGKARYRWDLIRALPPMRRTRLRSDVEAFLAPLRAGGAGG